MSHLVPNPPPANYHVPGLFNFNVLSPDGRGKILAWGANDPRWLWRVGTDNAYEVVSEASPGPLPDLTLFDLRGARPSLKLAIFVDQRDGHGWKRFSEYINVDSNVADHYAAAFLAGTLPKSRYNNHISFYPFGALQAYQPMSEADWMNKVEDTLGAINRNEIGRAVLRNISIDITIFPYLPAAKNAWSDVHINPQQWTGDFRPGAGVDEILLHELIHRVENNAGGYQDRWGFMFDATDFLTVNATNVYSCMLGRALRKDHHSFMLLPDEHFRNPKLHYNQQKPNYKLAESRVPNLVSTLKNIRGVWNPFSEL